MTRVMLLVGDRRGRFPGSNCLLVKGSKTTVLVDAGCRREQILEARDKVDAVVYTHIHPDHITHHKLLAGKPAVVPEADAPYTSLEALARRYAPEIWMDWIRYAQTVFGLDSPPTPTRTYGPWEEIRVGDVMIEAIPAPGHTRGHHVLLIGGHLHLSDIDLTGFGPWYAHPESSLEAFISDIRMIAECNASVYTTSHREREFNREEVLGEADRYLESLCRQVRSVASRVARAGRPVVPLDLAGSGVIYKVYLPGMETVMEYFEANLAWKILDYMTSIGAARRTPKGYLVDGDSWERACTVIRGR